MKNIVYNAKTKEVSVVDVPDEDVEIVNAPTQSLETVAETVNCALEAIMLLSLE